MTIYQVIFKDDKYTLEIEYKPLEGGALEIVSVYIQPRPVSPWQQRQEERPEALQPYKRIEQGEPRQMDLFE